MRGTHRLIVIWSHIMAKKTWTKEKRTSQRERHRGRRTERCKALIPAPSVLLLATPSISFIPPTMVVSCLLWSKPTKSLTVLKPEQHGGELSHTLANCEWKLLADGWTDKQRETETTPAETWGQSRRRFFFLLNPSNNSCNITTRCPSNDRVCCNYMTFSPPK